MKKIRPFERKSKTESAFNSVTNKFPRRVEYTVHTFECMYSYRQDFVVVCVVLLVFRKKIMLFLATFEGKKQQPLTLSAAVKIRAEEIEVEKERDRKNVDETKGQTFI